MSDTQPQPAHREWRAHLTHPLTLTTLAAVSAVLALVGPFGTIASLNTVERAAYWLVVVAGGYVVGYLLAYALLRDVGDGIPRALRVALAGIATGAVMTLLVVTLNRFVFGFLPGRSEFATLLGTVIAISAIVMAVIDMFNRHAEMRDGPGAVLPPPILDRLPLDKRGALVALSVEDHYVRVRTTRGEEMLLLRLADAIREVGDTPGAQVHRSHWAAFGQVACVTRQGDRALLQMRVGDDVPVSRANLPKLKEAGLLPR